MKKASKIILINPEKEILLYLRDDNPLISHPGYWDFIGGGIENCESPLEAIKREVKEEIGIKLKKIINIGEVYYKKDSLGFEDVYNFIFKGEIDLPANKIKLNEGRELRYFKLSQLNKIKISKMWMDFLFNNRNKIF